MATILFSLNPSLVHSRRMTEPLTGISLSNLILAACVSFEPSFLSSIALLTCLFLEALLVLNHIFPMVFEAVGKKLAKLVE